MGAYRPDRPRPLAAVSIEGGVALFRIKARTAYSAACSSRPPPDDCTGTHAMTRCCGAGLCRSGWTSFGAGQSWRNCSAIPQSLLTRGAGPVRTIAPANERDGGGIPSMAGLDRPVPGVSKPLFRHVHCGLERRHGYGFGFHHRPGQIIRQEAANLMQLHRVIVAATRPWRIEPLSSGMAMREPAPDRARPPSIRHERPARPGVAITCRKARSARGKDARARRRGCRSDVPACRPPACRRGSRSPWS